VIRNPDYGSADTFPDGEALKGSKEYLLDVQAKYNKCKYCAPAGHQWIFGRNAIKVSSSKTKRRISSLI
jgi:hypothetical protein